MRKLLLISTALMGFLLIFFLLSGQKTIKDPTPDPPVESKPVSRNVDKKLLLHNQKASRVKSLFCKNAPITMRQGRKSFFCQGELAYEKPRNFRLKVRHRLVGDELDIGSNSDIFWFWSKRLDSGMLYFCKHANYGNSKLKSFLNPEFMVKSLGVDGIVAEKCNGYSEDETSFFLYEKGIDGDGLPMNIVYVLAKTTGDLQGVKMLNDRGVKTASSFFMGQKIVMEWPEEDISMTLDTSSSEKNRPIPKSYWLKPEMESLEIGE